MTPPTTGEAERVPGSFRDPAGFLYERDGTLYRQISCSFASVYDAVDASGLYTTLISEGLLVDHQEVDLELAATPDAYRVLRPERLPFVSFPYEWCPAHRREAALHTLRIQEIALDHGMTLRDASAYNVQFRGTEPVFIDSLSFEPYVEGKAWSAYRQFCQHFLAPLALETYVDVRLAQLLTTNIDGVPLDLASRLLPNRTYARPSLLTHLHGHAKASSKREATGPARTARFTERANRGLIDSLRKSVDRMSWDIGKTAWSEYYDEADHYTDAAMAHKVEFVDRHVGQIAPKIVWDLGANTGRFSRLAAQHGAHVVAFDVDHGAVEAAFHDLRRDPPPQGTILPLVADLRVPSPAIGWAHRERPSLAERGPVDAVLALALVHHLAIGNNVPLEAIASLLAELGQHAIVEFVPKEDPKTQVLLATREDVFPDYHIEGFEAAFRPYFTVVASEELRDSGRSIHLLARR